MKSRFLDSLVAVWILFVAVVYFGAPLAPQLWLYEPTLLMVYGAMLIASVVVACLRWLARPAAQEEAKARGERRP